MSRAGYMTMGAVALAAAIGGCAGNGHGLDANGNPITPGGGGGSEPLTATFQSIQDNIFTPICTRCHIGASAPEGLQLDAAHSYSLLVGVPSTEQPAVQRVNPGNPDISYVVEKLEDAPGISGGQMPLGGPYLPQSTIDVVKQWVASGAPKGAAAPAQVTAKQSLSREPRPLNVTASSPDNDSIVSMVLPNIVVAFDGDLDPSLVNTTNISVEQVTTAASIPFAVTIPHGDGAAILISPRRPLESGIYRVTLHRDLADMDARALGADYTFTFTVDASQ